MNKKTNTVKEILIFGLSENQGGIETYLKKIWDNIDHSKYHFNFIDITGKNKVPCFYNEFIASGASFYKVTPRNVSFAKNRKEISELFKNNHFDVFHFNVNSLSYVFPVNEAIKNRIPVIVHSRNGGTTLSRITLLFHYCNKMMLQAKKITRIAVSTIAGEWLFGSSRFTVYNNGVDDKRFTFSETDRQEIRNDLQCGNAHVIGNVGAFLPAKNHEFIIKVFDKVLQEDDKAVLWLIGEGPGLEAMKTLVSNLGIEQQVYFLGKRTDITKLYAGMDCFFFPSLYEGFPNAVLEAECEGLPCVISDTITKEVLIGSKSCMLNLSEDENTWVECIIQKLSEKNNDRIHAHEIVRAEGLSVEQEIERIEKLYSSLCT